MLDDFQYFSITSMNTYLRVVSLRIITTYAYVLTTYNCRFYHSCAAQPSPKLIHIFRIQVFAARLSELIGCIRRTLD